MGQKSEILAHSHSGEIQMEQTEEPLLERRKLEEEVEVELISLFETTLRLEYELELAVRYREE